MTVPINLFRRLAEVLPSSPPLMVGDIAQDYGDGTVRVTLPGGGVLRVRNPQSLAGGSRVFVQGGVVTGVAPALPVVQIEI